MTGFSGPPSLTGSFPQDTGEFEAAKIHLILA